jgi:hypothetical protein
MMMANFKAQPQRQPLKLLTAIKPPVLPERYDLQSFYRLNRIVMASLVNCKPVLM